MCVDEDLTSATHHLVMLSDDDDEKQEEEEARAAEKKKPQMPPRSHSASSIGGAMRQIVNASFFVSSSRRSASDRKKNPHHRLTDEERSDLARARWKRAYRRLSLVRQADKHVQEKAKQKVERDKESSSAAKFRVPVDVQHMSLVFRVWRSDAPHHRAFWLATLGYFSSFFSTFAVAALLPITRDALNLTDVDINTANVASVVGTAVMCTFLGPVCDQFGPRLSMASLLLITAPASFAMACTTNSATFIVCRCITGISLAVVVASTFWTSSMFSSCIVALVNATTAGWGNLGGGVSNFLMPFVEQGIVAISPSTITQYTAWRVALFLPPVFQCLMGVLILVLPGSQDLPDGTYHHLITTGAKHRPNSLAAMRRGWQNYRTWLLAIVFGMSFGVELTISNVIAPYFYDAFGLSLAKAGVVGSSFGLLNIFARSLGGFLSDQSATRFGMRGRLWTLYLMQISAGCLMIAFSRCTALSPAIGLLMTMALFVHTSKGAMFGIVPFVSKRALGVVGGTVLGVGALGSVVQQGIFLAISALAPPTVGSTDRLCLLIVGIMMVTVTLVLLPLVHFPAWGSLFQSAPSQLTFDRSLTDEIGYYISDYDEDEVRRGVHLEVAAFAVTSAETERHPSQRSMSGASLVDVKTDHEDEEEDDDDDDDDEDDDCKS